METFRYESDLRLDGMSTLSFHKIGTAVHVRIQHHGDEGYAVAVIEEEDLSDVAQALAIQVGRRYTMLLDPVGEEG